MQICADQTARVRKLVCAFVVRIWHKQVLSRRGLLIAQMESQEESSLPVDDHKAILS